VTLCITSQATICSRMQDEDFSLKYSAQICEVILNSHMKCQTGLLWTRPYTAKPEHAPPNHHVRSLFFWDVLQHWVVIPYWRFGTTYWSQLQGSRNPKEQSMTEVNWHNLLFWDFVHCLIFKRWAAFWEWDLFRLQAKKHLIWWTP